MENCRSKMVFEKMWKTYVSGVMAVCSAVQIFEPKNGLLNGNLNGVQTVHGFLNGNDERSNSNDLRPFKFERSFLNSLTVQAFTHLYSKCERLEGRSEER